MCKHVTLRVPGKRIHRVQHKTIFLVSLKLHMLQHAFDCVCDVVKLNDQCV